MSVFAVGEKAKGTEEATERERGEHQERQSDTTEEAKSKKKKLQTNKK